MPTTPHGYWYTDGSVEMQANTISALEASSAEAALVANNNTRQVLSFKWATSGDRTAQTGMSEGDVGYQNDDDSWWFYDGASWQPFVSDSGWVAATLQNGWTNYGSGYQEARYRKVGGEVYLEGTISPGTTTSGTAVFTLPTDMRPVSYLRVTASSNNASGFTRFEVNPNGSFQILTPAPSGATSFTVSFRVD